MRNGRPDPAATAATLCTGYSLRPMAPLPALPVIDEAWAMLGLDRRMRKMEYYFCVRKMFLEITPSQELDKPVGGGGAKRDFRENFLQRGHKNSFLRLGVSMKRIALGFACCFFLLLGGCTSVPPVDFTVQDVGPVSNRKNADLKSLTVGFAPQSQQSKVEANASIPPVWKEGLQDAINRSLLFRDDGERKVNLSVRITEFDIPSAGVSMKTKVSAIYEIVDRGTGDLLFAEKVTSEGVVPFDYAFVGVVRMVESWNRAVRNNIADFLNLLEQADISKPLYKGTTEDKHE